MKTSAILLFIILLSHISLGQVYIDELSRSLEKEYTKFVRAILSGDTTTAMEIEKNAVRIQPIEKKTFTTKNNPEHIFKLSGNALRDSIISFFKIENGPDENKFLSNIFHNTNMPVHFAAETNRDTIFSREYFSSQRASNDVFLTTFHDGWLSKFYYSGSHPLIYLSDFAVQLSKIDSITTRIKVVALNPEVINGMGIGVHGPKYEYSQVEPTSIEEYSILLFIADKLGDKTLLPLKLPNN